jgi:hypothetical protein
MDWIRENDMSSASLRHLLDSHEARTAWQMHLRPEGVGLGLRFMKG